MTPLQAQIIAEVCDAIVQQKKLSTTKAHRANTDPVYWVAVLGESYGRAAQNAVDNFHHSCNRFVDNLIIEDYESSLIELAATAIFALENCRAAKEKTTNVD